MRQGRMKAVVVAAILCAAPIVAQAQFHLGGRPVQIHGFVSQGFAYTGGNDFLTMNTSDGSFAYRDGALNLSTPLTDKFRVGAQVYVRQLGNLSKGQVSLDWATADYRFKEWFGIRGGKVKTTLGLYNDTQDMDFLHTPAILPQSMYPLDLRSATIAHTGGDLYGDIKLKSLGMLSYTVYAGMRPNDPHDGYRYFLDGIGMHLSSYGGRMIGEDIRWNTPLKGLLVGSSYLDQRPHGTGTSVRQDARKNFISQFYTQYTWGNLRLDGEYRRDYRYLTIGDIGTNSAAGGPPAGGPPPDGGGGGGNNPVWDSRSWYTAAAYRLSKRFEVGGYYSRFVANWSKDANANDNHIYDKVATVRVDLTSHWNLKVEGHFMDGYGAMDSARGFYSSMGGFGSSTFKPKTNMLVIRTGFNL